MLQSMLEITDVRKQYGHTHALNGVSLTVAAGECFGLLGPNGAGKTTLLSIVGGLLDATGGSVKVDGHPFNRDARAQRHLLGIGTQDLAIYPELTARENIEFFGKLYHLEQSLVRKRAEELLHAVGLLERADHRAGTFSGGMKRRLNLAVAVVHAPKLLLLDEPTTGVDPQSRNLIFEIVRKLSREGMTIIYTSHYLEEVQALCPRIGVIDGGKLIACDTLSNLLKLRHSRIVIKLQHGPTELLGGLRAIPGVLLAETIPDGVMVETDSVSTLLPRLAEKLHEFGANASAIEVNESTLEKVFLHLTGHDLRD
jgi:ABC-2 type transport system ATP-binding protein